ncbi:TRAP transporter small permease subunit [Taklimakanibacter deserti]|uniref:TRAP transporter small permease subunit n=1 Tax=Taklimakanibacter deserti TaxID=2267839 RepID=UPI000E64BC33
MDGLLRLSRWIDAVTAFIGRHIIWLILAAILVSAINAVIRKAFDISSNAWLELQWYLFGCVFMVAAAYTLQRNEHIRIDIVSSRLSQNWRNWIDIFGHVLMLLPFAALMTYESVPFVWSALRSGEMSGSAGGLIIWPARAFILVGFFLLFIQGISELTKRIAVMKGLIPDPHPHHGSHAPLEPHQ